MPSAYPLHFAAQLRSHLRALRKKLGLTQAQLGELVGVSQARIAEIEANPGVVNFEQMLQLLSALGVTLSLQEDASVSIAAVPDNSIPRPRGNKGPATDAETGSFNPPELKTEKMQEPGRNFVIRQKKGTW
jgi:HTH-type transcriptional regulator/antitoxin HipB